MSLTLERVSFAYGRGADAPVPAVSDVSFTVEPGELVLVVGPTGSGKSTLMMLAAGLLAPASGRVAVDGTTAGARTAGGQVGLIFQDPEAQLFADSVLEDVAFGPRNLGLDARAAQDAAREAMAAVGLDPGHFGGRSPFTLSGGEARRAAIAGVLAMRPRYLLADEPTAGLDALGRRAVSDLILEQRERAGVVVVSHAAEQFLAHADRLVVMGDGGIVWSGSGQDALVSADILEASGLRLPDVLEVQRSVSRAGLKLGAMTLDPVEAANHIAAAKRRA